MAATLAEEIRKRKVADALNGQDDQDDSDQDVVDDTADVSSSDQTDGASTDLGEEPALAEETAIDEEAGATATAQEGKNLGYKFVPVTPTAAQSRTGTNWYMGEEGADVSPALTTTPVYSTPIEQGDQQYVIDQDTGAKIPRAQLATSEDIAAQPPTQGAKQLEQIDVTGQAPGEPAPDKLEQVERGELVKPPAEAPGQLTQVERAEMPPGGFTQRGAFMGEEGAEAVPSPPKVQRALGYKFVPLPAEKPTPLPLATGEEKPTPVPLATGEEKPTPVAQRAQAPDFADRAAQWRTAMQAYGFDARINPDGSWVGTDAQGKEVTPEQNKGLYQFGAMLSKQYGFSGQEAKPNQLQDLTAPGVKRAEPVKPGEPATQAAQQPDVTTFRNPNGSAFPARVQAADGSDPAAVILHHTSGRGTVEGVLSTLRERGLGVQYVVDRAGNIFATGGPGAQNILPGWGSKGTGLNNKNIVGIEVIAKDDADVTPAQKVAVAQFLAARYPTTTLFGHGEVNPGHKEEDEGASTKAAALALRDQLASGAAPEAAQVAGAPPQAQPATKQANGLYQNEKPQDFLSGKVTTFATPQDIASGQDNGVGAPRLGKLDTTTVAGVAIPEEALRAKYGNNYAAWRRARVDIVDTQTGKRLRVPIVDLGPRGDMTAIGDMTPTLSNYFGGDRNLSLKLVDNAGPDVTKNPQLFADEQAAIKQGFDSSALQAGVQKIVPKLGYKFNPVDSDRQNALTQQFAQAERKALSDINNQFGNSPVGLYKRLDQPIPGVSDSVRREFQTNLKAEITKSAQDFYNEPDPNKAFQKATSDASFGTVAGDVVRKVGPYLNQAITAFNQSAAVIDQNRLDELAKAVHPEASADARKTFIDSIVSQPDSAARAAHINAIIGQLAQENPNNPALAALRATDIADSADRLADPEYQKRQKDEIAREVAQNMRDLRPDPRLQGTPAQWWADQLAQLPKNVVEGMTGPVGDSLLVSEIYQGTMERLRQENPGLSDDQLKAKIGGSAATQVIAMMTLNRLSGGKLGTLVGQIENPAARLGASALMHTVIGGTIGAAQQVATNIAEGKPALAGVPQAAAAGAVQALPGAVISGLHGAARPAEEPVPPVTEERPPPAPERRPVTRGEILGPDEPDASYPWFKPGPIITRAAERTAFSPDELARGIDNLRQQGWSPDQLQQVIENLQPEPDWARQRVYLSEEALAPLGEQPPAPIGEPTEPMPFQPPTAVGESEPWVSKIANRFTAERIINNEIGPVQPGQGVTTEGMLAQGLKMGPEEINQHVSDLMNGVGDPKLQAAAIRTEEARLSQRSNQASRFFEADPTNQQAKIDADNAFKDLTDFHNGPVAKLKNNWHAIGMELQGEMPIDLSTYNGLRDAFVKNTGKPVSSKMEATLRKAAQEVRDGSAAEKAALANLGAEIRRRSAADPTIPDDVQIRNEIMAKMKNFPCPT